MAGLFNCNHIAVSVFSLKFHLINGSRGLSSVTSLAVSGIFVFYFFYLLYLIIPAVVFTSGHCHHLSVEWLAIHTHRKILPAIMPRNAGCISPRARPRGNPSHFLSERPESKTSCSLSFDRPKESEPKEKPSALLYRPILFLHR